MNIKELAKKLTTMRSKDYTDLLPEKIAEELEVLNIIPILLDDEIQMILPYHITIEWDNKLVTIYWSLSLVELSYSV